MTDTEHHDIPPEVQQAVDSFAPYKGFPWKWYAQPIDGNYDPNRTLSATLHTVEGATASSPTQIALYRNGVFKGQGTPVAGAFISMRHEDCTDDTVAVRIKIPGESHAGPPKSLHDIDFKIHEGQLYWSGDWPFHDYAPPLPGWSEILQDEKAADADAT